MKTPRSVEALRHYQCQAIEHMLANPQAGLFLDMGLGKTASALTCLYELDRFGCGKALVVGPIRVIETVWRQEARLWEHTQDLTFSLIRGSKAQRAAALEEDAKIYLVNPEHLQEVFELLGDRISSFETLVIDESSMFKNSTTKRFKALRQSVKKFARRYILTGTPTPNKLMELWPQIYLLDGGKRLGTSFYKFREQYFYTVDRYGYKWQPKPNAVEKIYAAIADLVLRMDAKDYLELPPVVFNRVEVQLPEQVMSVYRAVEDAAFAKLTDTTNISAMNVVGAMMKCRQIANGVVYTHDHEGNQGIERMHSAKMDATKEIIEGTGSR